jgi:hypothetical protein
MANEGDARMSDILAVDDDQDVVTALQRDLPQRFAADYRVVVEQTPEVALQTLWRLRDEGADLEKKWELARPTIYK